MSRGGETSIKLTEILRTHHPNLGKVAGEARWKKRGRGNAAEMKKEQRAKVRDYRQRESEHNKHQEGKREGKSHSLLKSCPHRRRGGGGKLGGEKE